MAIHVGWDGLSGWASKAQGDELIGAGIRPYGMHAGNLAALVAYPYLLFEEFEQQRKAAPGFTYQVWMNDIEPVIYVGADGRRESANVANMYPGSTTFQYTPAPGNFKGSLTDYWQSVIQGVVEDVIGKRFPAVKLEFHRASELRQTKEFAKTVVGAAAHAIFIGAGIQRANNTDVEGKLEYVWPLSPDTHAPMSRIPDDAKRPFLTRRRSFVTSAQIVTARKIAEDLKAGLDFALHFRMLQTARLAAIQPKLWIMGVDHLAANRNGLTEAFAERFMLRELQTDFLHVPLLFTGTATKLSKSLETARYMDPEFLIKALRDNGNLGLNVTHAPTSDNIAVVGVDRLPSHIIGRDKDKRRQEVEDHKMAYRRLSRQSSFVDANRHIDRRVVALAAGVPHL